MGEAPSVRFELLRQLAARYWRPLITLAAGIPAALSVLQKALGLEESTLLPDYVSKINLMYWLIGYAFFVFVIVRFPRISVTATRLILGSPKLPSDLRRIFRGPRPYGSEDVLPGRQGEIDDCWMHIQEETFFILEGESGCGKTSILNAVLLPKADQNFRVISCRIADDPFGKLRSSLLQENYHKPEQAVDENSLAEAITRAAQSNSMNAPHSPESTKPLLLCIDQFEELFVTVKSEMRGRFLTILKEAIEGGKLRLILAIRNDFRDLLFEVCRTVDPKQKALNLGNYYTLQAFSKEQAEAVLGEILKPVHGNDPLMKQQLEDFIGALVLDLLRPPRDQRLFQGDEKTVLPVELQTVGMMIESIGIKHFSVAGLRRLGGKIGLLRAYIEDAKDYAWRKTGIHGNQTLLILRQLISPAQTKWSQTAQSIGEDLGIPSDLVEKVLDAFAEKYLVNPLPIETLGNNLGGLTFSKQYELMHEHLVQILAEAPDPVLQKARDAQERLIFWIGRTKTIFEPDVDRNPGSYLSRISSFLAQPIPLMESLRLWRFSRGRDERRMLRHNLRGFCLRMAPLALFMMIGTFSVYQWYQKTIVFQGWHVKGKITGVSDMRDVRIFPQQLDLFLLPDGTFNINIIARRISANKTVFPLLRIEHPEHFTMVVDLNKSPIIVEQRNKVILLKDTLHLEKITEPPAYKPMSRIQ